MGLGKELLHMTPKALSIKRNIDRLDFIKIKRKTKTFILKVYVKKLKRKSPTGRKHLQITYPSEDSWPEYTKNYLNLTVRKQAFN